jgi:hypothetical protein
MGIKRKNKTKRNLWSKYTYEWKIAREKRKRNQQVNLEWTIQRNRRMREEKQNK